MRVDNRYLQVKGAMAKKDDQDICAHLLWFSTNFSEILSIGVFYQGCLNGAFNSDLTLPHSAYFALHSAHFALFFQLFCFSRQKTDFWCAGLNLNFVNILILYFLTYRVRTVHILHCTAHILHHFHNFFVFQAREL